LEWDGNLAAPVVQPASSMRDRGIDLFAGSIGGTVGGLIGHPFDVVKTRMQSATSKARDLSMTECFKRTINREGAWGLWRGVAPPVIAQSAHSACCFAGYQFAYKRSSTYMDDFNARVVAGMFSGAVTSFISTPAEMVKIQLQLDKGAMNGALNDSMACVRRMVKKQGPSSLFGGLSACIIRDAPTTVVYFLTYEECKRMFTNKNGHTSVFAQAMAGGIAGSAYWAAALPADVVKTRIQEARSQGRKLRWLDAISEVRMRDGWKGLLRGAVPLIGRAFPVNAICFLVYERTKQAINGKRSSE